MSSGFPRQSTYSPLASPTRPGAIPIGETTAKNSARSRPGDQYLLANSRDKTQLNPVLARPVAARAKPRPRVALFAPRSRLRRGRLNVDNFSPPPSDEHPSTNLAQPRRRVSDATNGAPFEPMRGIAGGLSAACPSASCSAGRLKASAANGCDLGALACAPPGQA